MTKQKQHRTPLAQTRKGTICLTFLNPLSLSIMLLLHYFALCLTISSIASAYSVRFRAFPSYLAFRRFRNIKVSMNHVLRASWYLFRDTSVASVRPRAGGAPRKIPSPPRCAVHAPPSWQIPPATAPHGRAKQGLNVPFFQSLGAATIILQPLTTVEDPHIGLRHYLAPLAPRIQNQKWRTER